MAGGSRSGCDTDPFGVLAMLNCRWTIGVLWAALAVAGCRVQGPARKCPDGSCTVARRTMENEDCPFPIAAWREVPVVNLPQHARCRNYAGGSCVIASTVSLFRWQGRDDLAELFRGAYGGGQSASSLHAKLEAHRVRYAYTTSGDAAFLEWAARARRRGAPSIQSRPPAGYTGRYTRCLGRH